MNLVNELNSSASVPEEQTHWYNFIIHIKIILHVNTSTLNIRFSKSLKEQYIRLCKPQVRT